MRGECCCDRALYEGWRGVAWREADVCWFWRGAAAAWMEEEEEEEEEEEAAGRSYDDHAH